MHGIEDGIKLRPHLSARQVLLSLHQPCSKEMNNDHFSLGKSLYVHVTASVTIRIFTREKYSILALTACNFSRNTKNELDHYVTESLLMLQYVPVVIFKT